MITNSKLTLYHQDYDEGTRLNAWKRYNYDNVWWFGGKGSNTNKGYDNANDIQIRIPYSKNDIDIKNIQIGDILIKGQLDEDIETQQDLQNYDIYNVTAYNNNDFGSDPHVHISGK